MFQCSNDFRAVPLPSEKSGVEHFLPPLERREFFILGVPKNRWNIGTLEQILTLLFRIIGLRCSKIFGLCSKTRNVPIRSYQNPFA
jgi:hypothetical protein